MAHACAAVDAAAALRLPVTLVSAAGAGTYAGPAWFKAIVDQAAARHPEIAVTAIIDCGDAPGMVLAALRAGLKEVRFNGSAAALDRLRGIAAAYGAGIDLDSAVGALDLLGCRDAARLCRDHLAAP